MAGPIWDPQVAIWWSTVLTAAFGALVHAQNWKSLGNRKRAFQNKVWATGIIILTIGATGSEETFAYAFWIQLGSFLGWYFLEGREQVTLVKISYGASYQKKSWTEPLLLALVYCLFYGFRVSRMGSHH